MRYRAKEFRPKTKPARNLRYQRALECRNWVQGWDLNPGPSGYEPDELPDCSTLQQVMRGGNVGFVLGSVNGLFHEISHRSVTHPDGTIPAPQDRRFGQRRPARNTGCSQTPQDPPPRGTHARIRIRPLDPQTGEQDPPAVTASRHRRDPPRSAARPGRTEPPAGSSRSLPATDCRPRSRAR